MHSKHYLCLYLLPLTQPLLHHQSELTQCCYHSTVNEIHGFDVNERDAQIYANYMINKKWNLYKKKSM